MSWKEIHNQQPFGILKVGRVGLGEFSHSPILPDHLRNTLLDKYPFSERYGWVQDKYGLSWQLILSNPEGEERPFIVPSLMFVGDVAGRAEEAII